MKNGEYNLVVAPENYPGKKYRGRYATEHAVAYWEANGVAPKKGEVIHHLDGNKKNNRPENLVLTTNKTHGNLYHKGKRKLVRLKCPICKVIFVRPKNQTHLNKHKYSCTTCSKRCSGKLSSIPETQRNNLIKENVIEEFIGNYEDYR